MQKPPSCLVGGHVDDARDDAELIHLVRIELDLIEEGQDGTQHYTRRDLATIRRWLQKRRQPAGRRALNPK